MWLCVYTLLGIASRTSSISGVRPSPPNMRLPISDVRIPAWRYKTHTTAWPGKCFHGAAGHEAAASMVIVCLPGGSMICTLPASCLRHSPHGLLQTPCRCAHQPMVHGLGPATDAHAHESGHCSSMPHQLRFSCFDFLTFRLFNVFSDFRGSEAASRGIDIR